MEYEDFAKLAYQYSREAATSCLNIRDINSLTLIERQRIQERYRLAKGYERASWGKLEGSDRRAKQHRWNISWLEKIMNKEKRISS